MPGVLQIRSNEPLRQLMEHQIAYLIPLPFHPDVRHPFPLVDVAHLQRTEFLAPQCMIEQYRQDSLIPLTLERGGRRRLQEHPCLMIAQRRRHPLAIHRARPLHPEHGVMQHGVTVAEIGIERRQGRELAPDGVVGKLLPDELLAPGDSVRIISRN